MKSIKNAKEAKDLETLSRLEIIEGAVEHALKVITDEASDGQSRAEVLSPSCVKERVLERLEQLNFRCLLRADDGRHATIKIHW